MTAAKRHFTPALFAFLRELEAHNEKPWWDANKDRYLTQVRDPALDFIVDFGARLATISPHFVAEAKTMGGSLMRPYRDTRFSADKTPYKTNVGIQFRHEAGTDIHAPGYYIHLEPGACFAGVGLWHPETAVARALRQAIYDDVDGWSSATKSTGFQGTWSLDQDDDEMLKRVPSGFDPAHPHADDLRMKSFMAGASLSQKQVTSAGFDETLAGMFTKASGFTRFLCEAIELPF
jgi:uncharacterized protein (TIGR02453 family)